MATLRGDGHQNTDGCGGGTAVTESARDNVAVGFTWRPEQQRAQQGRAKTASEAHAHIHTQVDPCLVRSARAVKLRECGEHRVPRRVSQRNLILTALSVLLPPCLLRPNTPEAFHAAALITRFLVLHEAEQSSYPSQRPLAHYIYGDLQSTPLSLSFTFLDRQKHFKVMNLALLLSGFLLYR